MRKGWFIVVAASVALFIVIGTAAEERGWENYLLLMRHGAKTDATVMETGNGVRYTFKVAGLSYFGSAATSSARVGQTVPVTYLPNTPSNSCLGSPGARLADEMASLLSGRLHFPDQY